MSKYMRRELERSKVIKILASASEELYWDIYLRYFDILKDFDIIYVDNKATDYGKLMKDFFHLENGLISSCFHSDKLKFINEKVFLNNLNENDTKIFTSFDIELDTNVVSELDKLRRKKSYNTAYKNDLLSLTKRRNVHSTISIGPYLSENYYNNGYELNETMIDVYYNFLLTLNKNSCDSFVDAVRDSKMQTEQFIDFYKNEYKDKFVFEVHNNLYKAIYLNLLKMVQLNRTEISIEEKVFEMFKFQNEKMYKYLLGEMNIAIRFFEEKYNFAFFSKLQNPKKEKLISFIKNMAWDIYHLRNMEVTISLMEFDGVDFVFPMLFSFDRKFNELRESIGLRLYINDKTSYNFYPFYKEDRFNKYIDLSKMRKMRNKKAKKRRIKKTTKINYEKLIAHYENEVVEVYFEE